MGDPDGLAKAILQLSNDPDQRRRMGAAARQRVMDAYTADQMCRRYMDVILNLKAPV
jgi:glycosyltransferase involved in cell wall biosynthesis